MMIDTGLDKRNPLIATTAICLGVGVTQVEGFFDYMPSIIGEIFAGNMVAGVFVVGLIMEILLPKDPAKYEAVVQRIDEEMDIDTHLFYEESGEQNKEAE